MDDRGWIHIIEDDEHLKKLSEKFGELQQIPYGELGDVINMNRAERRTWYRQQKRLKKLNAYS